MSKPRDVQHVRNLPVSFNCWLEGGWAWVPDPHRQGLIQRRRADWYAGSGHLDSGGFYYVSVDPWELRKEFLDVTQDLNAVVDFLNRNGMDWYPGASSWTEADFHGWQQFIRMALLRSPKRWVKLGRESGPAGGRMFQKLTGSLHVTCVPPEERPKGLAREHQEHWLRLERESKKRVLLRFVPSSPLQAILGTVLADVIMATRFRVCARTGCGRIFKTQWRREKYCTPRCAHTQSMRDSRRRRKSKRRMQQ
jgi:hypothetical protein